MTDRHAMLNRREHHARAMELLDKAREQEREGRVLLQSVAGTMTGDEVSAIATSLYQGQTNIIAAAQVHATLAITAPDDGRDG